MKSKMLLDAFDGIDASMILEAEPKEKEVIAMTRKRKHFKPLILIAAVVLILAALSITAVADATRSEMEPYWNREFAQTAESGGENLLGPLKESVTIPPDATAISRLDEISAVPEDVTFKGDNDDVRFAVTGVTGAGGAAYVWMEIVLSDELIAQYGDRIESLGPGITRWRIDGRSSSGGASLRFLGTKASLLGSQRLAQAQKYATDWRGAAGENGGPQADLVSRPDNTYCYAYRFQANNISSLSGKKLTMIMTDINAREQGAEESFVIAEGVWEVQMTLNFTESVLRYRPPMAGQWFTCDMSDPDRVMRSAHAEGALTEAELASATVQISPIYLQIDMQCKISYGLKVRKPNYAVVVMRDGTSFEVRASGGGASAASNSPLRTEQTDFFFDEPIDHEQVSAIIYGGLTFPLNENTMVE